MSIYKFQLIKKIVNYFIGSFTVKVSKFCMTSIQEMRHTFSTMITGLTPWVVIAIPSFDAEYEKFIIQFPIAVNSIRCFLIDIL